MKKYYNIHVNLTNDLAPVSFALHTDERVGNRILNTTWKNVLLSDDGDANCFRVALYYHMADHFIAHRAELAALCKALKRMDLCYFDNGEDSAAFLIGQGIGTNDIAILRKGLFRAFVHYFNSMVITIDGPTDKMSADDWVFEYDPNCIIENYQQHEKECYSVELDILDFYGNTIEEFYEVPLYLHPYLGEMMLADYKHDLLDYSEALYEGLMDALRWKAAQLLVEEHVSLKRDGDDETPLEVFWTMACDMGEIDEDEYAEIISNLGDPNQIEQIYEIICDYGLLNVTDCFRESISVKDHPRALHYED